MTNLKVTFDTREMNFKIFIITLFVILLCLNRDAGGQPVNSMTDYNIVIIIADDLGYSDIGSYGGAKVTPNIDRLAEFGMKFNEFYTSPICSPTRASLFTGAYAQRVGLPSVIGRNSLVGINPEEKLLPEILQDQGYHTALIGKWHLGDHEIFHPQKHGFDEFFGTPASNDMGFDMDLDSRRYGQPGLLLLHNTDTVSVNPQQWKKIEQYTERSVDFISRNSEKPFFLVLSHNMPHTPIFVSNKFAGKSNIDLYHDVLMELDWSVGKVVEALENYQLTNKTLVVFLSDNGPWLIFGNHNGTAYPLSGGKRQTLEGGVRVPAIMSLPGLIPKSTESDELTTIMDLYPTIANLTNAEMTEKKIDGINILPILKGDNDSKGHEVYFYYHVNALQAVRKGDYKLQLPHRDTGAPDPADIGYDGKRGGTLPVNRPLALYNIKNDPSELNDISRHKPSVVQRLLKIAEGARDELGDSIEGIQGEERRKPGRVIDNN